MTKYSKKTIIKITFLILFGTFYVNVLANPLFASFVGMIIVGFLAFTFWIWVPLVPILFALAVLSCFKDSKTEKQNHTS